MIFFNIYPMKWCCISLCLVREWCVGFSASPIHLWLSHMMNVCTSYTFLTSAKNCLSHTAYIGHWLVAMYSVFVRNNAMVDCFLHFHEMTRAPTKNTHTIVDRWSFLFPAQHALQNPLKAISLFPCIIYNPKCPLNISWCISQPSNAMDQPST